MYARMKIESENGQIELTAFVTGFSKLKTDSGYVQSIAHLSSEARIWHERWSKFLSCVSLTSLVNKEGITEYFLTVAEQDDPDDTLKIDVNSVRFIECPQFCFGSPDE